MRVATAGLVLLLVLAQARVARADDGPRFRPTTPRASVELAGDGVRIGVPGGRAWGVESGLLRAPRHGLRITLALAVIDPSVREAFVRVAWYARADGRSRQLAVDDSEPVRSGEERTVSMDLDPPESAVAYRVRVLARLGKRDASSPPGAIRAAVPPLRPVATPLTRLVPPEESAILR